MPCNCGKKKSIKPTGTKPEKTASSTTLNTNSGRTQTFDLRRPDGKLETYGSKLEALAARARYGGSLRF